ncbi:MAG: phytanoyl-CoA dioxygenase family protein [Pseudomonadota bacterium]
MSANSPRPAHQTFQGEAVSNPNARRDERSAFFDRWGVMIVEYALDSACLKSLDDVVVRGRSMATETSRAPEDLSSELFDEILSVQPLMDLAKELCWPSLSGTNPETNPRPVRLLRAAVLDKTPEANWFVPWHQDRCRPWLASGDLPLPREARQYGLRKQGVGLTQQIELPPDYLARMVTLRIHLDTCGSDDGPLEVVRGSHRKGVLDQKQIAAVVADEATHLCLAERGDILAMRPLVVHRSQRARIPRTRRVLHLDLVPDTVSGGQNELNDTPMM